MKTRKLLVPLLASVVAIALCVSFVICRGLRLPLRMSILIACGNSICGNSAIAAVAPVIGADGDDIAASISFTAVLGVIVVLLLPLAMPLLSLSASQYGVFAGLTVYAVPQVLAATGAVSLTSAHVGTLVKLVRVLMLGPVVLLLSLFGPQAGDAPRQRLRLSALVPWFIAGFLALMALRSAGLLPPALLKPAQAASSFLTVMSMAALGLGVDARSVLRAGGRVTMVVVMSLLVLSAISLGLIHFLHIA